VIRIHSILSLVCGSLLVAFAPGNGISQEKPARHAPNFALTTLDGKPLNLSDHSGKVVLLDFWATWCVPCQTEVPRFVSFQKRYGKQGFQVIGISMDDSPESVRKFYAKYNMNYPVALETEKVANDYGGVLGLPLTYLIVGNGTIVKQYDASADLDVMERDIKRLLESAPRAD
jgi:peroxiredoxin